jgi:hypothetical protein
LISSEVRSTPELLCATLLGADFWFCDGVLHGTRSRVGSSDPSGAMIFYFVSAPVFSAKTPRQLLDFVTVRLPGPEPSPAPLIGTKYGGMTISKASV